MSDPLIFHDYIMGIDPWWRSMLEGYENGTISRSRLERAFFMPGVGFNRSAFLATLTLLSYRACGEQAFVIGPRLQEMFDHTSLEDVEIPDIKLPYEAFYIATPDCPWQVWGGSSGWHNLTGVLVRQVENTEADKGHGIFIYIWGAENENSTHPGDDASYWLTINMEEAGKVGNLEDYLIQILMDNTRDTTANDYAKWFRDTDHVIDMPAEGTERRLQFVNTAVRVARLVVNMCMYINSQGPELTPDEVREARMKRRKQIEQQLAAIKNPKKRKGKVKALTEELQSLSTTNVVWLGKTIEAGTGGRGGRGPQSGARKHTWVRGHWWPRLSTLRAQQVRKQSQLDEAAAEILECKQIIANTDTPAELAAAAVRLGDAVKSSQEATVELLKVVKDGDNRRRWVQPYERNKDSEQKVKGHIYQVEAPS